MRNRFGHAEPQPVGRLFRDILRYRQWLRRKVWYHAGARTNLPDSAESRADLWMKSNFELQPAEGQEVHGIRITFYEILSRQSHLKERLSQQ